MKNYEDPTECVRVISFEVKERRVSGSLIVVIYGSHCYQDVTEMFIRISLILLSFPYVTAFNKIPTNFLYVSFIVFLTFLYSEILFVL